MNNDKEMEACVKTLRTAVNNECEVTVARRVTISNTSEPKADWWISFGDILNKGKWAWNCAHSETLQGAFEIALDQITKQGDERSRDLSKLHESAAKFGLKLVEATP
jgi:hypothetical protein